MGTPKDLSALPLGLRQRTWVTARLASRLGAAALKRQLGIGPGEQDEAEAERRAVELVSQLGRLKGLVMKVGQMASYLPGSMPPAAQRVMAQLQDSSTPMTPEVVSQRIEEELGAPVDRLFQKFEPVPFAAASIGQVHAAEYQGQRVAVKVQYPGIEEVLKSDLKMAGLMVSMMSAGTAMSGKSSAEELTTRILEECDYQREARRSASFKKLLETEPGRRVPA